MRLDRAGRWLLGLSPWQKLALAVWGVLLGAVCVRAAFWPEAHSVYPIFALAARKWLAGQNLYILTKYDVYRYSPLVAAAFVPLGLMPLGLGSVLWRLLGAGVYAFALAWWGRVMMVPAEASTSQRCTSRDWLALYFLLVLPLSLDNLNNGQSNVVMIGLVMFGVLACGTERWNLAAVCLAVACLLKIYPLAVALLLAACYPRRFAPRFALVLFAGLVLPFALQRPSYVLEQYASWLSYLRQDERQRLVMELWYRDLRLLAQVCGVPLAAGVYKLIQLATGAGIAGLCLAARRAGWPHRRLAPFLFGLGCCWMTVFGVAAETSTYMIMAPIASWLVVAAWRDRNSNFARVCSLGFYLSFGIARAAGSQESTRWFSMIAQPTTSLLLFFFLTATAARRLWLGRADKATQFGSSSRLATARLLS